MIEHHNVLRRLQKVVHQLRGDLAIEVILQNDDRIGLTVFGHAEGLVERTSSHERQTEAVALGRDEAQPGGMAGIAQSFRHIRGGLNHGLAATAESGNHERPLRAFQRAGDDPRQLSNLLAQARNFRCFRIDLMRDGESQPGHVVRRRPVSSGGDVIQASGARRSDESGPFASCTAVRTASFIQEGIFSVAAISSGCWRTDWRRLSAIRAPNW